MTQELEQKPEPLKVRIAYESTPRYKRTQERMAEIEKTMRDLQSKQSELVNKKTKQLEKAGFHPPETTEYDEQIRRASIDYDMAVKEKEHLIEASETNSHRWVENRLPEYPLRIWRLRKKIQSLEASLAENIQRKDFAVCAEIQANIEHEQFELDDLTRIFLDFSGYTEVPEP
jgi:hypothetical protein